MPRRLLVFVVLALLAPAAAARAGVVNGGLATADPRNPLAGVEFGTYASSSSDPSIDAPSAYANTASSQSERGVFEQILRTPRFRWFTSGVLTFPQGSRFGARQAAQSYVRQVTGGDPDVAVQVAVFRLEPFEQNACRRLPTDAEVRDYRAWIREFAAGLGDTRTALILQPDMPFTLCQPRGSTIFLRLIAESARIFNALEHTTVYIDGSAIDYLSARKAADMLARAGVGQVRGFALDLTHFSSRTDQTRYGQQILSELRRKGIRGKHFLVDTAQNGRPFTVFTHRAAFRAATACRRPGQRFCVTPGQAPSYPVGGDIDGFVWSGRPWVNGRPARPRQELLDLIRSSPFFPYF